MKVIRMNEEQALAVLKELHEYFYPVPGEEVTSAPVTEAEQQ